MPETKKYSETHEQFAIEIALNHVHELLRRESSLTRNSPGYIFQIKEYIEYVKGYLDALSEGREKNYPFIPYLEDAIKYTGKEKNNLSKKDTLEAKSKFTLLSENLDKLRKNPHTFYMTNVSKDMKKFFENFKL